MSLGAPPPDAIVQSGIFIQPLSPIGDSLTGSFFVGIIPLILVLVLLGVFHIPAHYSAFAGLVVCIFIAIFGWHIPAQQAFEAIGNGMVYANWPIMWIVVNSMYIYNITVRSGIFHLFRRWMISNTPPDNRIILLIIGFSFGALLEGVAGFGVPCAICSSMLVSLGFEPFDAIILTLIFNTTPVAFGALGIPTTTLANLTGLPVMALSAMMGRQLPFVSLFLPAYALLFYAGPRAGLLECWPAALVAGVSFSLFQAIFANLVGPELPDLMAGLASMIGLVLFVQFWKPPYRLEYEATTSFILNDDGGGDKSENVIRLNIPKSGSIRTVGSCEKYTVKRVDRNAVSVDNPSTTSPKSTKEEASNDEVGVATQQEEQKSSHEADMETQGSIVVSISFKSDKLTLKQTFLAWSPWILVIIVVIIWTFANVPQYGQVLVEWPHLHEQIWLTLYGQLYKAVWVFQPLATGTAILVACIPYSIIVLLHGSHHRVFWIALKDTIEQLYKPVITVTFILAFAYLYNYSGIAYTIGYQLASVGRAFPFLSAWLGWLACFLSGSDTSANSLFGNLQVVAAREIGLSTILMAATNSCGAVTSKMISPQNLTTGVSTIGLQGQEGKILRKTIFHSVFWCCIIGAMACIIEYVTPGIIPPEDYRLS